jgi:hypothetical protein
MPSLRGQTWLDTFGKPPSSLFDKYMMIHVVPTSHSAKTAFLHKSERVE